MLSMTPEELAMLDGRIVGLVWLAELQFTSGTYRFCTFNRDLTVGANTYQALGNLASVGDLRESADTDTQTLTLTLSVANQAMLAAALGNVEGYRGRPAIVSLLLMGDNHRPVGSPRERFRGEMEPVRIPRNDAPLEGGQMQRVIELPISRSGLSRARSQEGLRITDEQQQQRYPGDLGLNYLRALVERPALWLSKRFQEI